jgi:hypothetical protein
MEGRTFLMGLSEITFYHFESKERVCEVSVLSYGVQCL